jgi:hypothetical protein
MRGGGGGESKSQVGMGSWYSRCCRKPPGPDGIALQLRKGRAGDKHSFLGGAIVNNPEGGFQLAAAPTPLLKDVNFAPTMDSDTDDAPSPGEDAQIERMLVESHSSGDKKVK